MAHQPTASRAHLRIATHPLHRTTEAVVGSAAGAAVVITVAVVTSAVAEVPVVTAIDVKDVK